MKSGIRDMKNQTLAHFRHFRHFRHSFNYTVFPTHPFMQNKPNFRNDKMNINSFKISKYEILHAGSGQKTKPIQTQFNPIQSQFNPIQSQFKANQTQSPDHGKKRTLRMFRLNIFSNKLKWINFVKNSCIPEMEDNASEQIKSLLGVPK